MLALKKVSMLKVLHLKILKNAVIANFMANDFKHQEWKVKAAKNAYKLISQHRTFLGAAFFLLADQVLQ